MPKSFLLGVDQGTSGTKAVIVSHAGQVLGYAYRPVTRIYPRPGWVEQYPTAVASVVSEAITEAIKRAGQLVTEKNLQFGMDLIKYKLEEE